MRTSAFFGVKIFGFFEIYGVFTDKGVESIFRHFVRTSFMDDPLP